MTDAGGSTPAPRAKRGERAAARRDALSGAGPTGEEPARNPGARGGVALFGEVLTAGLLITLVGLAVATLPAALAAGIRHLRRYVAAEDSRLALFWADVRAAIVPGLAVGAVSAVIAGVLVFDILLARTGALPGGIVIEIVGWILAGVLAVALLSTAGAWTPERGWLGALRTVPAALRDDVPGALYLAATAVFVGVAVWALVPLFIPAIGCAALAVVAIPERRRAR